MVGITKYSSSDLNSTYLNLLRIAYLTSKERNLFVFLCITTCHPISPALILLDNHENPLHRHHISRTNTLCQYDYTSSLLDCFLRFVMKSLSPTNKFMKTVALRFIFRYYNINGTITADVWNIEAESLNAESSSINDHDLKKRGKIFASMTDTLISIQSYINSSENSL